MPRTTRTTRTPALAAALAAAAAGTLPALSSSAIVLPFDNPGRAYEGIGALSGGGGVTRFLIDYPQELQQDIYDILFKPNAGASLQYIKIEIGGDTQSTEGTEASHEHFRGDLNCSRGYEWGVVVEAKKRNPAIKTFVLSWGVPGWIGDGNYYSEDNLNYHLDFLYCAETVWGFQVDYMGIWNERTADPTWTKQLRAALDGAGYDYTRIVAADQSWSVLDQMEADPDFAAAVDIIGVHYPGTPPDNVFSFNKSVWASEMWNLGVVDDWNGAGVLASDLNQHALWGLSSSILWCLIFSWFAILPFSRTTDTNAGLGHSILTAAEPWSGHYDINPTIYAMAHHTQFAQPGWTYLSINSTGMGNLPQGGTYVTVFNSHKLLANELEFSIIIQTTQGGPSSPQQATFAISGLPAGVPLPTVMHVWQTTESAYFVQQPDVTVGSDGSFTVTIPPDAMVSITTTTGQGAANPANPIPPSAAFPFPYSDNFEGYAEQGYAKYFSDEGGLWVVMPIPSDLLPAPITASSASSAAAPSGSAYYNVVDTIPIAWETNPAPYTLIGNMNGGANQSAWTDYTVSAAGMIDPSAGPGGPAYFGEIEACAASTTPTQVWIVRSGAGNITSASYLESKAFPGMCLGVDGADPTTAGATATGLVPCNITTSSRALFTLPEGVIPGVNSRLPDPALSDSNPSPYMALPWQINVSTSQIFSSVSGQCIDVDGEAKEAGTRAVTWPCKSGPDAANQFWNVLAGPFPSTIVLQSQYAAGMCLDLTEAQPSSTSPFLILSSRINTYQRNGAPPQGYNLKLVPGANSTVSGSWTLSFASKQLAGGSTGYPVVPGTWYQMQIIARGTNITATVNGQTLPGGSSVTDSSSAFGMIAIGSGWHHAWWDNVVIANNTQAE